MQDPGTFRDRLEVALKARRIGKMYVLAMALGVDESAISRWRRGKPISTGNLIKLCEVLDLSIDWLLTGRGAMQRVEERRWQDILAFHVAALDPTEASHVADVLRRVADGCDPPAHEQ